MLRLAWIPAGMLLCVSLAPGDPAPRRLSDAASAFLFSLRPELRTAAALPFESEARTDWHYIPRARPGVLLRDLNEGERRAARSLLRAALSSRGYLKAEAIMHLDQVLRDLSIAAGREDVSRDPLLYSIAVYGAPGLESPWAWKVEGHHISLNFTSIPGQSPLVTTTPAFLGTAPDEIHAGPQAGLRPLASESELAWELLGSLDSSQRARAVVGNSTPGDIVMAPGASWEALGAAAGLPISDMTPAQRETLMRLIREFAGTLADDLARERIDRVSGSADIRFAWMGAAEFKPGTEPGRHYYRIRGDHFLIEYDTVAPNHVHTVWRDPQRDFGGDPLREHHQRRHRP